MKGAPPILKKLLMVTGLISLAVLLGFLSGCGGESKSTTTTTASAVPFDRAFIDAMVPHHRSAIEMAKAAQEAGLSSPALNSVALSIIESQQQEIDRMLRWRKDWYGSTKIDPNAGHELGMSEASMGMNHNMNDLKDGNIDGTFASMMIGHHEGAIRMAELALERAQHSELKTLAHQIIAAQKREVKIMKPFAGTGSDHTGTGMNMG